MRTNLYIKRFRKSKTIFIIIILSVLTIALAPSRTPAIKDSKGKIEGSIASLEEIDIGGISQYILVRGNSQNNPILLFLHGGPGYPQISYARKFQSSLEENFIVVNWDQRGAGKSYSDTIAEESMNREQFILDTHELVEYLCRRFDKDKIFLVGHSWGSDIGIETANRYPERFHAYIGIGQAINTEEQENISYEYVLSKAKEEGNEEAISELDRIGHPPYKNHEIDVMIQRKWLMEYGGAERNVNTLKEIILGSLLSPEYTWIDGIKFYKGNYFTRRTMFNKVKEFDLFNQLPELKIPAYFCLGRYDYNTPSELVVRYYNQLEAPKKKLFWFEESAHEPHFEEPDKFAETLLMILEETKGSI